MTSIFSRFKIRYSLPLIFAFLVICITIGTLAISIHSRIGELREKQFTQMKDSAEQLQSLIEELLRRGNLLQAKKILMMVSHQNDYLLGFVENSSGKIVLSTKIKNEGQSSKDIFSELNIPENIPCNPNPFREGKISIICVPVEIEANTGGLIHGQTGKLWLFNPIYDLEKTIWIRKTKDMLLFSFLLLASFLTIGFSFYRTIIRRMDYLRETLKSFSLGNRGLNFSIKGSDELAEFGQELGNMAMLVEREEKLLIEKEKLLTDLVGNLQGIAYKCSDISGRKITFISDGCVFLTGYSASDFLSSQKINFGSMMDRDEHAKVTELIQLQLEQHGKYEIEYQIKNRNGAQRWVLDKGTGTFENHRFVSREGLMVDVTASKEVELKILERDRQINQYLAIMDTYVLTTKTDPEGVITYVSDAFARLTGYTRSELIGKKHSLLRDPSTPKEVYEEMWKILLTGSVWNGELKNRKKNGEAYWVNASITSTKNDYGKITEFTAIRQDISDRKKIEEIAITDEMTGLFNRRFFNQTMPRELNRAMREKKKFIFLMADVDFFKRYNDNYGHQKGDQVLEKIGDMIRKTFRRSGDFAFRLGGEEFGIFWHADDFEGAVRIASIFRSAVEHMALEHRFSDVSDSITISVGVCFCQEDYRQEQVYRNADEALYEAKHSGRNQIRYRNI